MPKQSSPKPKIALITGAARGIGATMAAHLAREGHHVVLVDALEAVLETAKGLTAEGGKAKGIVADVSSEASVRSIIAGLMEQGGVDILVNNAGISPKPNGSKTLVQDMELSDWERVMKVNLTATFMFSRGCIPNMIANSWGRIINTSSMAGRSRSQLAAAHYAASKAGMIGFSRTLAAEVAPHGITVNCIAPGRIRTPMSVEHGEKLNEEAIKRIPVGRLGTADEIGALVAYLASQNSGYITGATIDINGGEFMG